MSENFGEKEISLSEKTVQWEEALAGLEAIKDKLGKGIDENIKETVAAFLVNNFPTRQSCEGHLESRSGTLRMIAPYVDIAVPEPKERFAGEEEIKEKIAAQFDIPPEAIEENDAADAAYWNYISDNHIEETSEYQEARKKNEELRHRAEELIGEFYNQRSSEMQRHLHIRSVGASELFRVEGAGGFAEDVPIEDAQRCRSELADEQGEMTALAKFLKERFLEESK